MWSCLGRAALLVDPRSISQRRSALSGDGSLCVRAGAQQLRPWIRKAARNCRRRRLRRGDGDEMRLSTAAPFTPRVDALREQPDPILKRDLSLTRSSGGVLNGGLREIGIDVRRRDSPMLERCANAIRIVLSGATADPSALGRFGLYERELG